MKNPSRFFMVVFSVSMAACDKQTSARLDQMTEEVKAIQADSRQMTDQLAEVSKVQESLVKDLTAALSKAEQAGSQLTHDLAAMRDRATEQQKKSEQQIEELRASLGGLKSALDKISGTIEAQSRAALSERNPSSVEKPPAAKASGDPSHKQAGTDSIEGVPRTSVTANPGGEPKDLPPTKAKSSGTVRTGGYKFIEKGAGSDSGNAQSSPVDPRYAKSFVAPMNGIAFRYDGRSGTWRSGRGSVPPGGDPETFAQRLERMLKSDGRIPKTADLLLQSDGSILIHPRGASASKVPIAPEPTRVPDPKELGKTAAPPDPGSIGSGGAAPSVPKEQ